MTIFTLGFRLVLISCWIIGTALAGCVAFEPALQSKVENLNERPSVAILPFGFDLEITKLSAVKTVDETLSPEDESKQFADALREIQQEARWLLVSRLATGQGFWVVPPEQTDALAEELQLKPGDLPNAEQLAEFRQRLVGSVDVERPDLGGGFDGGAHSNLLQRSVLNAARSSLVKISGSSQAAKWPPLSTSLK